jgi:hypothetical protein
MVPGAWEFSPDGGLVSTLYQVVEDLKITLIGGDDVIYAFGDTPLIGVYLPIDLIR